MEPIELLSDVLAKTGGVIAGVGDEDWGKRTPCTEFDVDRLVDHMVGWAQVFAGAATGRPLGGDPRAYRHGDDPAGEFAGAAGDIVGGWRERGFDRSVRLTSADVPGQVVFNMTLMEYLTHGWDLATATGQEVPFSDVEASETLARAEVTLPPQYRGEGMAFGPIVPVPADAPPLDQLIGFMGRRP